MSGIRKRFRSILNRVGRIFRRKKKSDKKIHTSESNDNSQNIFDEELIYEEHELEQDQQSSSSEAVADEAGQGKESGSSAESSDGGSDSNKRELFYEESEPKKEKTRAEAPEMVKQAGQVTESETSTESTDGSEGESDSNSKDSTKNSELVRTVSDDIIDEEFQYACLSSNDERGERDTNEVEDSKAQSNETSNDTDDETLLPSSGQEDHVKVSSSLIAGSGHQESQFPLKDSSETQESVEDLSTKGEDDTRVDDYFKQSEIPLQTDVLEVVVPETISPSHVQTTTCAPELSGPKKGIKCRNPFVDADILKTVDILVDEVELLARKDPKGMATYEINGELKIQKPDAMIVVSGQEFSIHRSLLMAESTYFKEAFTGQENKQVVLHINSEYTNCTVFQAISSYFYTGIVEIPSKEFLNLWCSSNILGMPRLIEHCKQILDPSTDNIKNLLNFYQVVCQLNQDRSKVSKRLAYHFEKLILHNDFLDFTPEQVVEVFSQDQLGARSEIVVFLAALKWANHDFLEREEFLVEIFRCIRFTTMTMNEIVACFHPPILPGVVEMTEIKEMLLNATCYLAARAVHKEHLFDTLKSAPRTLLLKEKFLELWNTDIVDPKYNDNKAATKIQAAYRGYRSRKAMSNSEEAYIKKWYSDYSMRCFFEDEIRKEMGDQTPRSEYVGNENKNYRYFLKCVPDKRPVFPEDLE